jgi:hypothetical protein
MLLAIALVALLAAAPAWAAEIQGKIKEVDTSDRAFVLEDGTKLWLAEGLPMDHVKEGKSVTASYEEKDGKKMVTNLQVID